jgi:hypothetical protein
MRLNEAVKLESTGYTACIKPTEAGIEFLCLGQFVECVHLLKPHQYGEFLQAIDERGLPTTEGVILALQCAMLRDKGKLVDSVMEQMAQTVFSWIDFD